MNDTMDNRDNDEESIPDFIQLQQVPVNYIQQVDTDLLDPVVFNDGAATSDGFCRFTLQNKGFLSSEVLVERAQFLHFGIV